MRREFKKKSKILLIDDNYEHLVGIRELLNLEGTFDVVGIATNVTVGLNLIKRYFSKEFDIKIYWNRSRRNI